MKSDPLWNEIRHHIRPEQPSTGFTEKVIESVRKEKQQPQAASLFGKATAANHSKRRRALVHQELKNALLAIAATFFFVISGAWSFTLISLQEGTFSMAIRETVSHSIYASIQLLSDVIH